MPLPYEIEHEATSIPNVHAQQISCITDVFNGIALMYEPAEDDTMLARPRDVKRDHLVSGWLILYSYGFYGNLQSLAAFITWFVRHARARFLLDCVNFSRRPQISSLVQVLLHVISRSHGLGPEPDPSCWRSCRCE